MFELRTSQRRLLPSNAIAKLLISGDQKAALNFVLSSSACCINWIANSVSPSMVAISAHNSLPCIDIALYFAHSKRAGWI